MPEPTAVGLLAVGLLAVSLAGALGVDHEQAPAAGEQLGADLQATPASSGGDLRFMVNPSFDAATLGRALNESAASLRLKLSNGVQFRVSEVDSFGDDSNLHYDDSRFEARLSQLLGASEMRTLDDDYAFAEFLISRGMYSDASKLREPTNCSLRLFDAADHVEVLLADGSTRFRVGVGLSETSVCVVKMGPSESMYDMRQYVHAAHRLPMCNFRRPMLARSGRNQYHVSALAGLHVGFGLGERIEIKLYLVDSAGYVDTLGLSLNPIELRCETQQSFSLSAYDLDLHNRGLGDIKRYYQKFGPMEPVAADEQMREHFAKANLEAAAFYKRRLLYSRGLRLVDERIVNHINDTQEQSIPKKLYAQDNNRRYSIQAMEVYDFDNATRMHFAGLAYAQNGPEVALEPLYIHCVRPFGAPMPQLNEFAPAEASPSAPASATCTWARMPDPLMPVDFVYLELGAKCKKLLALYSNMLRIFEPDAQLHLAGQDYSRHPYRASRLIGSDIRAAMFNQGLLYLFSGPNRLFVHDLRPRLGQTCDDFLWLDQLKAPQTSYLASELLVSLERRVKNMPPASYQYNPERHAELLNNQLNWYPPLAEKVPIPPEYHLYPPLNDTQTSTPTESGPGERGGSKFSLVIIICAILIALAIACAIIYYYFFARSPTQERDVEQGVGQLQHSAQSALGGQLTARSALSQANSKKVSPQADQLLSTKKTLNKRSPRRDKLKSKIKPHKSKASKASAASVTSVATKSAKSAKSAKSGAQTSSPKLPATPRSPGVTKTRSKSPGVSPTGRNKSAKK